MEIKKATNEEVVEQKSTTKKDKNVELANELSAARAQLKQNNLIFNGGLNEQGQEVLSCDKILELNSKLLEMKELENKWRQVVDPKMRYEKESRWQHLNAELNIIPLIDKIKKGNERVKEQKEKITENTPKIKKRINQIEKKLGEKVTEF